MKKVLLISPTVREYRELPAIAEALNCKIIYEDFACTYFDDLLAGNARESTSELRIQPLIDETIERYRNSGLAGVTSAIGYPGMPVSSLIAGRLGLPGPRIERVLLCEHKYYSRLAQRSLVPEAVPNFHLIDPNSLDGIADKMQFPLFLKPVKSCFSINADTIVSADIFRQKVRDCLLPAGFLKPLNELIRAYTDFSFDASYLLAESLLEGRQVSLDGYVFEGSVQVLGIVDSVMYPGTISFQRFEYPSSLPEGVQDRITNIARTLIKGIGYDNALFNLELMYNHRTDEIHIIEINPKIASQFADLFEKVDGLSSYAPLLQIAVGEKPHFPHREGAFGVAASCVLRTFENKRVVRVPSKEEVDALVRRFPDARIEISAVAGSLLSDVMQDGKSYRYGLVNIGADSSEELELKLELCKSALDFRFTAP
ncbi:MAG: hypothetical protein QOJ64_3519 [Acidobacteriota bacterium]|nr:hypothetical protein [Acidobacteriota bacterium]